MLKYLYQSEGVKEISRLPGAPNASISRSIPTIRPRAQDTRPNLDREGTPQLPYSE